MANFLGLADDACGVETAGTLILPAPYEGTVTYGKGTAGGPQAVIDASQQVELYDEHLDSEPWRRGIATLPALQPAADPEKMVRLVEQDVARYLAPDRLVVLLGGEHSLTSGAVAAHLAARGEMGVIQFDAHADLRDEYEGSRWNHACVMARVREKIPNAHVLQLGIRSLSREEADLARREDYGVVQARELLHDRARLDDYLPHLPEQVYITFDVDVFDPAVVRATGTPEPGGLDWYTVVDLLERIFAAKRVVGFDVMELCDGDAPSAFTVARLLYRMIGFRWAGSGR